MKVQMRSNDIFYGLTFDAPFFSFLHQSVYLILKDQYQDLEIGTYHHFADNIHFYERHFELADKIRNEKPWNNQTPHFELKQKFIDYDGQEVKLTQAGQEFIDRIDNSITEHDTMPSRDYYKEILQDYFKI